MFSSRLMLRGTEAPLFVLHYRFSTATNGARLGMVIPKRYAKSAVLRNAIKRQAREAFRLVAGRLPACDLVLRLARVPGGAGQRGNNASTHQMWRAMLTSLFESAVKLSPDSASR